MKSFQTLKPVKTTVLVALIALTVACGYSAKMTPPVAGTVPAIVTFAPPSATAGSGAFTLTVNGTSFGSKAVVNFNGAPQTSTAFVSGSQLTVAVPASAVATPATITVTVTNPGTTGTGIYGSGGTLPETSSPMSFMVN
jgi:IPT/TIG domain-containing protein